MIWSIDCSIYHPASIDLAASAEALRHCREINRIRTSRHPLESYSNSVHQHTILHRHQGPSNQKLASLFHHDSNREYLQHPSTTSQATLIRFQSFPRQPIPSPTRSSTILSIQRRIKTFPARLYQLSPTPLSRKASTMPSYPYDSYSSASSRTSSAYSDKRRYEAPRGSTTYSSSSSSGSKSKPTMIHNNSSRPKDPTVRSKDSDSRYYR